MRSVFVLLVGLSLAPAFAQVTIAQQPGDRWMLENSSLRVTLDPRAVAFDVLDKRCGREWRGIPRRPAESYGWTVPAAPAGLGLDFTDRWPAPAVALDADSQTEGRQRPRPEDLSATLHAAWTSDALLVSVSVRDAAAFFPKADEPRWWNWDSLEFWLADQQFAVLPAPPGGVLLLMGKTGAVPGSAVKSRIVPGGWQCEFSIPWPAGGAPGDNVLRFALGVNDADSNDGVRKSQLYFPRSWRHSAPDSFARTTFLDFGQEPKLVTDAPVFLHDIQPLPSKDGLQMTGPACSVTGRHIWDAILTLRLDGPDLIVGIDRDPRDADTQAFTAFSPPTSADPAELYGAVYCDGIAIPDNDLESRGAWWTADGSLDMPWIGYGISGGPGYALLFEDADDAGAILEARGQDSRLVPVAYHWPVKGKFAYSRSVRYGFLDRGGFVAMCKWYRKRAEAQGVLVTLRQKLAARPQLARIAGAPDFWGIDPAICFDIRRYGVRHAIVNGPFPADAMRRIEDLGYLVSRYDNYEDMLPGPRDRENSGRIPDDVEKQTDGSPVLAWLTWDKKTQYYKQCSMLYEPQARALIPGDLAKYPYNARFLDVTTACGLRECYDRAHPHTRAEDRDARCRLARYVSADLKLVLGGEHGRWWGVPFYDYFEGMQSGNRTSWPAGHVGINLPEKREDIGREYWTYGVGHQRRVPLWRLVFGDCAVSTWYWGDSTGHLYKAAPDVADRQDCFNLLDGTVPLFWVSQPYGFKWADPDLRLRLLQSYYVTCPVAEQTAFAEMTDLRYLSDDRAVQQSRFAGGVTVTVNFGDKPFTAAVGKSTYVLPTCGFLAVGKDLLAFRATLDGRTVTWVQTPTAMYADAGGKPYDFGPLRTSGRCAVEIVEPGNVRLVTLSGLPPTLNFSSLAANWGPKTVRAYAEEDDMTPGQIVPVRFDGPRLGFEGAMPFGRVLFGRAFDRPDLSVTAVSVSPKAPRQGDKVKVTVEIRNSGGAGTPLATVALYLDRRDKAHELDRRRTDIGPTGVATVTFSVSTAALDGPHKLIAVADPDDLFHEPSPRRKVAVADLPVLANSDLWPYGINLEVAGPNVTHRDFAAEIDLDLNASSAPADVVLVPSTFRVLRMVGGSPAAQVRAQFEPAPDFDGTAHRLGHLVFLDTFYAGQAQQYKLLIGTAKQRAQSAEPIAFDPKTFSVTADAYSARFDDGRLVDLVSQMPGAAGRPLASWIASSDAAFQWSSEKGADVSVKPLSVGIARTVVEVAKKFDGGFESRKLWQFYPGYIVLSCDLNKPPGVWSRTGLPPPASYGDSAGHATTIDGKGDLEGVTGAVKWYAAWTDKWGLAALSLSPVETGVAYWDAGVCDVGFSCPQTKGLRAAYVLHGGQKGADFAATDYAAFTDPVQVRTLPAR